MRSGGGVGSGVSCKKGSSGWTKPSRSRVSSEEVEKGREKGNEGLALEWKWKWKWRERRERERRVLNSLLLIITNKEEESPWI